LAASSAGAIHAVQLWYHIQVAYQIVTMRAADWPEVREIYRQGIESGDATFESRLPSWHQWHLAHREEARLVARGESRLLGWAALSAVSARAVYRGVAEVSVYVSRDDQGRGIGTALLRKLVADSERSGIWTLQAGIFPENLASIAMHTRCGFRRVGIRERIGQMHGRWRNVVLMERRSSVADQ
jgi:phosphinothricin acetyltransferase